MKKIITFLLITVFSFVFLTITYAHPGRTDSKGCHVCKKNCAKWGLKKGQYHCHKKK